MAVYQREFDRELEVIEAKVVELFAVVCEDLPVVTQALLDGDTETAGQLAGHEQAVNALRREIELLAGRTISLRAPVAADLRFLLAVLRVAPELARSHGLICHIASRAGSRPGAELSPDCRSLIGRMSDIASGMWRRTAACWYERDRPAAAALADAGGSLAGLRASLLAELASGPMALPETIQMTQVARFYERLGVHAASVARRVVYLAGPAPG